MAIKTLRVFAEFTSTGFVPMPTAAGIDYGFTVANTYPATEPSTFQTDNPDLVVTVTAQTDFYVWIRLSGTAWNPSYTRNVRVYPDSPDINSVVMNMIIATGPAGVSSYSQIVQTANRLYFNGATTDSVYNSKFAGKTYINELNFGTAPQLATVATSGAYADLSGKPALATVATSGLYTDLSSKPSGTAPLSYNSGTNSFVISQATTSTNGFLSSTDWNTFNNKYLLPSGGTTTQYLRGDGTLATFPTTLDSTRLILSGRNTTGTTLTKGTVVYINGVSGNTPLFARALATGDSTSAQTIGVVEFDIANNATGVVVLVGLVSNLDTSSYTEGVQLYLSGTTAGAFTSSKILAPTHLVYVGIVTRAHPTLGTIEVKIQNGYELNEIHDVAISSVADKDIIYRDVATNLWKNASVTSVLGFTPYNATNPNNYIARTALSASAPLSYNNTTGAFSIAQANGSTNGFLSSTDWTTFNNKQSALTIGNFTEVNSNVFMFPDGGTGKTIGNLSIQMIQAGASTNGYLSSTDWTTFNSKQSALTLGNVTEVASNVLMFPDGGTNKTIGNLSIQVVQSGASTNGYLSSTDWNTFNNKQGTITLTTTGTSGAATFSSGTLNIPNYSTALTGYVTLDTTQTISGAKTFSSALNGTSAIFSSTITGSSVFTPEKVASIIGIKAATSSGNGGSLTVKAGNGSGSGNTSGSLNLAFGRGGAGALSGSMNFGVAQATDDVGLDATYMTITSAGNVGIGTTSPSTKLHVYEASTSSTAYLTIQNNRTRNAAVYTVTSNGGFYAGTSIGTDTFNYQIYDAVAGAARLTISSGGNVGIGTTTPFSTGTRNLDVNGGAGTSAYIVARANNNAGTIELAFDTDAGYLSTKSNHPLIFRTNDAFRGQITVSGNFLLGTATDNGERLYVSGSIRATGSITANSDVRLKKNIERIENALEKVGQISGYTYNTIYDEDRHAGLIAQEVELVLPEIVNSGTDTYKGIEYGNISALLVEAIKEQEIKIQELSAQASEQQTQINELKALLNA